ncbi:hypothetical protein GJ496_007624 [Pomphorhynchus laevis]|nr:hypothetical protein GJ496_007624 [Pomphorhynchus laevis]
MLQPNKIIFDSQYPITDIYFDILDRLWYGTSNGSICCPSLSFTINAHKGPCLSVKYIDIIGCSVSLGGKDGKLIKHSDLSTINLNHHTYCNIEVMSNNSIWVPGIINSSIYVIDPITWKCIHGPLLWSKRGMIMHISKLNDNSLLMSFENGTIILIDQRFLSKTISEVAILSEPVMYMDALNENFCLAGNYDEDVLKISITPQDQLILSKAIKNSRNCMNLQIRPDNKLFACSDKNGSVYLRSCHKECKPLLSKPLNFHRESLSCIRFSKDSNIMACGGLDCMISLWNLYPPGSRLCISK